MATNEYQLVQKAIAGDELAFETLVRDNQRMVYSLALKIVKSSSVAEDIAQESFLKAYRNLESYKDIAKFSTWLYRITYNTAIDYIRKKPDEIELADWDGADNYDTPEEKLTRNETSEQVRKALLQISPDNRRALELFYFTGKKYKEVAEIMDIPINTVKTYIFRGKKELMEVAKKEGVLVT